MAEIEKQPSAKKDRPLSAMTLLAGFMMAESAEIGRRMGLAVSFRSMMTTWAVSPTFSLTQMNLSDSIVSVLKPMLVALMPRFCSCTTAIQTIQISYNVMEACIHCYTSKTSDIYAKIPNFFKLHESFTTDFKK